MSEPQVVFSRYVALGDSSTEGLNDLQPDGTYRGWADRLAYRIAQVQGHLEYANLAIRGRVAKRIKEEQLSVALELEPDLSTVVAGMNDLLRPTFKVAEVVGDIEEMFTALRAVGTTVVTFTMPPPGPGMPVARLITPRVARFNRALRAAADRTGALVLDLEAHPVASDPRLWDADRLHANSDGHERVAKGLAHVLGLPGTDESWAEPLPPLPRQVFRSALAADLAWGRTHLKPWVVRHIRGQSSGDGVEAKRPKPTPVLIEME